MTKATYHYDIKADVLYVTDGSDEPTYVDNIDDCLLLERGWFSNLLRGFCILGLKEIGQGRK